MSLLSTLARKALYIVTLLTIAGVMGFLALYLYVGPQLPDVESLREIQLQTPMRIYSADGKLINEFGDVHRIPVTLDEVPKDFINALIATEDQRFYEHSGVDFKGVMRAALNLLTTGRKSQGASTITMLVARNVFLSREKTFTRKIVEMFLAWKIENELSKDEILELFINKAHFSHRAYGLGAAAQVYYGTTLDQLTLAQLATLAGIPKGESKFNPISYPSNALRRRNHVLGRMLTEGYIDRPTFEVAVEAPITAIKHGTDIEVMAPYLAEMVRLNMIARFGKDVAYNSGLRVVTTVDSRLQTAANLALREGLMEYDRRHGYRGPEQNIEDFADRPAEEINELLEAIPDIGDLTSALVIAVADQSATIHLQNGSEAELGWDGIRWAGKFLSDNRIGNAPKTAGEVLQPGDVIRVMQGAEGEWRLSQVPEAVAGLVALKPDNGAIVSLVGGFDYNHSKYNLVTQARRQPGSNIKPFIYSAALEKGYTAASVVNDAPFVQVNEAIDEIWRPKNDSGKYKGPTRLRVALRNSTNSISVRLVQAITPRFTRDYLTRFGFSKAHMDAVPSLALGTSGFTPLEVALAYAILANGGYQVKPWYIDRVETAEGDVLFEAEPVQVCEACENYLLAREILAENDLSLRDEAIDPAQAIRNCPEMPVPEEKVAQRVIEERNAYIISDMLADVIHKGTATGTLARAKSPLLARQDLAGKTGTTNEAKDAWFSGYNSDFVATTWVGFSDHRRSLGSREYGGKASLPIWMRFMEVALDGKPEHKMPLPPGIVSTRIDPRSGKLAPPGMEGAEFEVFRSDYLPRDFADPDPLDIFNTAGQEREAEEPLF